MIFYISALGLSLHSLLMEGLMKWTVFSKVTYPSLAIVHNAKFNISHMVRLLMYFFSFERLRKVVSLAESRSHTSLIFMPLDPNIRDIAVALLTVFELARWNSLYI